MVWSRNDEVAVDEEFCWLCLRSISPGTPSSEFFDFFLFSSFQKEKLFVGDREKRDEEFVSFKAGKNIRLIRSVCDANVRVYM